MSLLSLFKPKGPSGFGYGSTAEEVVAGIDLTDKTVLVTGCNSGIGSITVQALADRGARILALARTEEKARAAVTGIVTPLACELSQPSSIRSCVDRIKKEAPKIDVLIANAGIMALPELQQAFGIELQFFTNHIGHFLLVTGLLDHLSENARVVIVSSTAHRRAPEEGIRFDDLSGEKMYDPWTAYGQSKLANILFTKELARRLAGKAVVNAVHPGVIKTNLARSMNVGVRLAMTLASPLVLKSLTEGAATQCWAAAHPDAAELTGEYMADCMVASPKKIALDQSLSERLWLESERIVARLP